MTKSNPVTSKTIVSILLINSKEAHWVSSRIWEIDGLTPSIEIVGVGEENPIHK